MSLETEGGAKARRSVARNAVNIVAGFAIARLLFAAMLGLGNDESYTEVIARRLQWSYFDHPPLHIWMAHYAALALGEGAQVRLPFIALFAATGWLLFALTRRLFTARAGLIALFALNAAPFFFASAGAWVVPDGPLLFALAGAAYCLARVFFEGNGKIMLWLLWLGAGLCLGLAGLAKYNAIFIAGGVPLFVIAAPRQRHWLANPAPYAAALIALAVVSPAILWNAWNDWVSLAFQGSRGALSGRWRPVQPLTMLIGEIALLSPWFFAPLVGALLAAWRAGWGRERMAFLLCLALPSIVFFTLAPLWGQRGLPHWPMPGWFFVLPLMGVWLDEGWARARDLTRWALVCAAALGVIALAAATQAAIGWASLGLDLKAAGAADPTLETLSWGPLRDAPAILGTSGKAPAFVAVAKWSDGGKVGLALGPRMPLLILSRDPRGLAFLEDSASFIGEDGVIIVAKKELPSALENFAPYFARLDPAQDLAIARHGVDAISLALIPAHGLTRRFSLPYPR